MYLWGGFIYIVSTLGNQNVPVQQLFADHLAKLLANTLTISTMAHEIYLPRKIRSNHLIILIPETHDYSIKSVLWEDGV